MRLVMFSSTRVVHFFPSSAFWFELTLHQISMLNFRILYNLQLMATFWRNFFGEINTFISVRNIVLLIILI